MTLTYSITLGSTARTPSSSSSALQQSSKLISRTITGISITERNHPSTSAACSLGHRIGEWVVFRSHLKYSLKLFVQRDGPWNTQRTASECALGCSVQSDFHPRNHCFVGGR